MTIKQIREKHKSLVSGGYSDMKEESRINYHTRTTIMALIEELEWVQNAYPSEVDDRIEQLKKELE